MHLLIPFLSNNIVVGIPLNPNFLANVIGISKYNSKFLIPKSLKIQLFKAVRDSFASEHGARMTAMHKATDNASELRDELKLTYNKARQASITNEILEIVGGAEALNN